MTDTVLTPAEAQTLRTAAHGTVHLMVAANPGPVSSTKSGMATGKAMTTATGLVGRILAEKMKDLDLGGKNTADITDHVGGTITSTISTLLAKVPEEVDNFRRTLDLIIDSAVNSHSGGPKPAVAEMARKLREVIHAA
ncbi:hypothetical protein [Streptomyces sp. GbtcB6]|uniref:hypothetical protein n=1 Tax=Streptomyces sp. GbtcB6 TaxID=2824751 RepID=UPI001C30626D|nr:hypothetical protein [Streptomyces sp. GbtcB6]